MGTQKKEGVGLKNVEKNVSPLKHDMYIILNNSTLTKKINKITITH